MSCSEKVIIHASWCYFQLLYLRGFEVDSSLAVVDILQQKHSIVAAISSHSVAATWTILFEQVCFRMDFEVWCPIKMTLLHSKSGWLPHLKAEIADVSRMIRTTLYSDNHSAALHLGWKSHVLKDLSLLARVFGNWIKSCRIHYLYSGIYL